MLEVTGIPDDWVRQANQMDEIWAPSHFNLETFRESGVTRPIYVIPLGVDPNYFHPGIAGRRVSERFTFLSVFEWGERKAPEVLLRAYAAAFSARDDVLLVLKVDNRDGEVNVAQQIAGLGLPPDAPPIALLYNQELPAYQMGCLYRSVDCYVSATRGEGWGMPVLEAMACGLPAITTNWSAQTEFMRDDICYPLRVARMIPAVAKCPYYAGFAWADPDEEHLAHLMRHVYEQREEARALGRRAADVVAREWTWEQAARRIVERLEALR
jgi:glycosyltransferase involved in cell wall biosynthesis